MEDIEKNDFLFIIKGLEEIFVFVDYFNFRVYRNSCLTLPGCAGRRQRLICNFSVFAKEAEFETCFCTSCRYISCHK